MPGVHVVTDSACDLALSTAEEQGIRVVPLNIRFGEEEFVDREQLSPKEFWDRLKTTKDLPETSAPSPGSFHEAFSAAGVAGASAVVCITLSSAMSATYQAARTAADGFGDLPVTVVDSRSVSMGQGLLALSAAEHAASGASLDEVVQQANVLRDRTRLYGVVNTLEFLRRGGRIGGAAALVGSLLSIKPVLQIKDGAVEPESKQRTRIRSLQYLASKVLEAGPLERLAVANGAADDLQDLVALLTDAHPAHELIVTDLGPVVGTHTGPGSLAVCFQLAF
jgi:DegV family protein with EDD domain